VEYLQGFVYGDLRELPILGEYQDNDTSVGIRM